MALMQCLDRLGQRWSRGLMQRREARECWGKQNDLAGSTEGTFLSANASRLKNRHVVPGPRKLGGCQMLRKPLKPS